MLIERLSRRYIDKSNLLAKEVRCWNQRDYEILTAGIRWRILREKIFLQQFADSFQKN